MKKIGWSLLSVVACTHMAFAGANTAKVIEPSMPIPAIEEESVSGFYAGLGVSAVSTHQDDLNFFSITDGQDRTGNVLLSAGYDWNEYIGLEARYMFSVAKEDIVDMDSWSIYVKPQYPITEDFTVYALLGIGGFDISGTNHFGDTISADEISFHWGLGVSYEVYENIFVSVDYTQVANSLDTDAFVTQNVDVSSDAISVGLSYHF